MPFDLCKSFGDVLVSILHLNRSLHAGDVSLAPLSNRGEVTDDNDASINALLDQAADIMRNADEVLAEFECAEAVA